MFLSGWVGLGEAAAGGNPVNEVDPSGLLLTPSPGALLGVVLSTVVGVVGVISLCGVTAGFACAVGAGIVAGGLAGAIGSGTAAAVQGQSSEAIQDAMFNGLGFGSVTGGIGGFLKGLPGLFS